MLGLTPNRVAVLTDATANVGAAVLALTGSLPHGWQPTAILGAAVLAKTGVVLKYLEGCQNWDRLEHDAALYISNAPAPSENVPFTNADLTALKALTPDVVDNEGWPA